MSNSILTVSDITRSALTVLHQKLNFVGNITRDYDNRFASSGAKIGDTLRVRLPNEYAVRTGRNMSAQDTEEASVSLTVSTQKGVDLYFTSAELALSIQDFTARIIEPAMARLGAAIEADALSMYKKVYNLSDEDGTAATLKSYLLGRKILNDNLAPMSNRKAIISTSHSVKLVDSLKTLFHSGSEVERQYRDGMMGHAAGFDFYENTLLTDHTTGTAVEGDTSYTINATITTNGTAAVTLTGAATTWKAGDVFTVEGCYRVHPETKAVTADLQQFVCLADCTTAMTFAPAIYTSGGKQNVSSTGMVSTKKVYKIGGGASETLTGSMVFHPSAFLFATADLPVPSGVDFAGREVLDGVSMRVIRDYSISDDSMPCRLDVLYGYVAARPQLACRIHADG